MVITGKTGTQKSIKMETQKLTKMGIQKSIKMDTQNDSKSGSKNEAKWGPKIFKMGIRNFSWDLEFDGWIRFYFYLRGSRKFSRGLSRIFICEGGIILVDGFDQFRSPPII